MNFDPFSAQETLVYARSGFFVSSRREGIITEPITFQLGLATSARTVLRRPQRATGAIVFLFALFFTFLGVAGLTSRDSLVFGGIMLVIGVLTFLAGRSCWNERIYRVFISRAEAEHTLFLSMDEEFADDFVEEINRAMSKRLSGKTHPKSVIFSDQQICMGPLVTTLT